MRWSLAIAVFFHLASEAWLGARGTDILVQPSQHRVKLSQMLEMRHRRSTPQTTMTTFHVRSFVTSRYSNVVVTSVIRNDADVAQEVSVEMRLPKTAFISNFSMEIDGVTYVGIVKEKAAAKKQYQLAVDQGQSAGLVTAKIRESQTFDVSVNIAAGSAVTFRLDYQELLKRRLGIYHHVIYADPGQLVRDFKVEVMITEPSGITSVAATPGGQTSSNGIDSSDLGYVGVRRSGTQAHVIYQPSTNEQKNLRKGDKSFLVTYDVTRETLGGEMLIKDGYFVHFFAPSNLPVMPKNVVFVIDKSGSMSGRKIKQTKAAFKTILDDLSPQDKFNIIVFSSNAQVWHPNEMLEASANNINNAKGFVSEIRAHGGTNFEQAAMRGVSLLETITSNGTNSLEQVSMLVLLTDGRPTVGITDSAQIRSRVKRRVNGRYSIFCLGFGEDLDFSLLNKLASENKGLARRIFDDSDAALQLKGFYDEVATPLLANIVIRYSGSHPRQVTKRRFDNYFEGSEIAVAGVIGDGDLQDGITAVVSGSSVQERMSLITRGEELDETFVDNAFEMEKLWAYLTIQQLQQKKESLENETEVEEHDQRITRLSLKYNFVTQLTSMVVTKPQSDPVVVREKLWKRQDRGPRVMTMASTAPRRNMLGRGRADLHMYLSLPMRDAPNSRIRKKQKGRARGRSGGRNRARFISIGRSGSSRRRRPTKRPTKRISTTSTTTTTITTPPTTTTTTTTTPPTTTTTTAALPVTTETSSMRSLVNPLLIETDCKSELVLSEATNITSPRFPGLYEPSSTCVWIIRRSEDSQVGNSSLIRISFNRLDLEESRSCHRDRIAVYPDFDRAEERPEVRLFCGYRQETSRVVESDSIAVVFESDDMVQGRGFHASLEVL